MCCLSWLALQTRWGGELRACDEEAGWGAELSPCSPLCSPSSFLGPAPTNRPLAVAMQQAALPGSVQQTAEQQAAATKPIGGAAWGCPLLFSLLSSLSHPSPSLHPLLDRSLFVVPQRVLFRLHFLWGGTILSQNVWKREKQVEVGFSWNNMNFDFIIYWGPGEVFDWNRKKGSRTK